MATYQQQTGSEHEHQYEEDTLELVLSSAQIEALSDAAEVPPRAAVPLEPLPDSAPGPAATSPPVPPAAAPAPAPVRPPISEAATPRPAVRPQPARPASALRRIAPKLRIGRLQVLAAGAAIMTLAAGIAIAWFTAQLPPASPGIAMAPPAPDPGPLPHTQAEPLPAPVSAPEPMRYVNPFDRNETFEFPPGTTRQEARDRVAQILIERARDRRNDPSLRWGTRHAGRAHVIQHGSAQPLASSRPANGAG